MTCVSYKIEENIRLNEQLVRVPVFGSTTDSLPYIHKTVSNYNYLYDSRTDALTTVVSNITGYSGVSTL